jgi:hypothetical protein
MIRAFIEGIGHDWPDLDPSDLLDHAEQDQPNEIQEMVSSVEEVVVDSDEEDEDD